MNLKRKEPRQHKVGIYSSLLHAHFLRDYIYNTKKEKDSNLKNTEYTAFCNVQAHIFVVFQTLLYFLGLKFCRGLRLLSSQMCPAVHAQIPSSSPAVSPGAVSSQQSPPALQEPYTHRGRPVPHIVWHCRVILPHPTGFSPGMGSPRSIHVMHPVFASSIRPPHADTPVRCILTSCASAMGYSGCIRVQDLRLKLLGGKVRAGSLR